MSILVFEDSLVDQLVPITLGRAACCVTVASYRLLDLLEELDGELVGVLRSYLRALQCADLSSLKTPDDSWQGNRSGPSLAVNARLVPSIENQAALRDMLITGSERPGVVWDGDQVAAIAHPGWNWESINHASRAGMESLLLSVHSLPSLPYKLKLMNYPHDVISANMQEFAENMQHRIQSGRFLQTADGVFLAEGASLGQYVICETSGGPIVIDEGAVVGPYTLLRGPVYIGKKSRILEHAAVKDAVSLGHTTKIGGEVEASVVEPYSNKQHHGFLGHSYLGSWINLGAGTCNSDLKNTYGAVNMEYANGKAATGMQFLGCVMGDYSKTAINTGIFTGKVIGVCSMMYGFVTSNVPSFVNYARLFGQMTTLPPEVMTATQQRMFARRKVQQRPCDMQLIHDMFRLTQSERDKFGDALSF